MWVRRGACFAARLAGASLLALVATRPAVAAELRYVQPSACASAAALSARTERALGKPLAEAGALRCTLHIVHDQGALAARLELDEPGRPSRLRSFRAANCERLTETLALAIVLAIGGASEPPGAPRTPPAEAADAQDDTQASAAVQSDAPRAHGARVVARAALVADSGTLPALGVGPSLGVSLGADRLELRALGTYLPARDGSIDASSGASLRARIALLAGALLGCAPRLWVPVRAPRLELGACVGAELGWLASSRAGASAPRPEGAAWWAGRLDLGGRWRLAPRGLGLDLLLSALVPMQRHVFQASGELLHRPALAVGRASLGVSVEFD